MTPKTSRRQEEKNKLTLEKPAKKWKDFFVSSHFRDAISRDRFCLLKMEIFLVKKKTKNDRNGGAAENVR